jgi:hypothetical protein
MKFRDEGLGGYGGFEDGQREIRDAADARVRETEAGYKTGNGKTGATSEQYRRGWDAVFRPRKKVGR